MTSVQKRIFLAVAVAVALSRFAAIAHSLWDWDEALFALAVRDYDVGDHRPHPPGYPLFIAAAKLVHLAVADEFRSLQTIVMLGAIFVFPAVFFLARRLGFDFTTSLGGALIFAFLPNVWLYGGTAFTDVPATVLGLTACALLLRGRTDPRAYILGAIVLGIAIGFRPPMLLVALVPLTLATIARLRHPSPVTRHPVLVAAILGGAVAAASYAGAAIASSSIENYRYALDVQRDWVRRIDSFHNPTRPPLTRLAKLFFVSPVQHDDVMFPLAILATVSFVAAIVKRNVPVLLTVATFAPLAIASWLQLDLTCASRYAIAYMFAHALLAADGLRVILRRTQMQMAFCVIVALVFAGWTWPALQVVRTTDAPPTAALLWAKANSAESMPVYVQAGLKPQARFLLAGREVHLFEDDRELAQAPGDAYVVRHDLGREAVTFEREHGRLWKIVRPRNFEASAAALSNVIRYAGGWHTCEEGFCWMAKEASLHMPRLPRQGVLRLKFQAPTGADLYFNGRLLETVAPSRTNHERRWILPARADAENELRFVAHATVRAPGDARELGLRLDEVSWLPAR